MRRFWLVCILLVGGGVCAQAQSAIGSSQARLEIAVRDGASGSALDGTRVTLQRVVQRAEQQTSGADSHSMSQFAAEDGRAFFTGLDTGSYVVNVRRLGFAPVDTVVRIPSTQSNVSMSLEMRQVAYTLKEITVRAMSGSCTDAGIVRPDLDFGLTAVLDAVRENAEREIILRTTYPFTYFLVRRSHFVAARREVFLNAKQDTVFYRSNVVSPYAVGQVVWTDSSSIDANGRPARTFRLPTLSDLADPVFLNAHCFDVRGERGNGSKAVVVVGFRPLNSIAAPDVEGELELNAKSLLLQRASFSLTRMDSLANQLSGFTVSSTYRLLAPGLAVVDEISAVQKLPSGRMGAISRFEQVQRLSGLRFVGRTVPGYAARKEDEDGARAIMPAIARIATPTSSDTLATLVGTIADEKGKILPSAAIWIGTSADSASNRTETDSLGHFRIAALPPGTTTIGVRRMGSRPSSFSLTLPRGDSLRVAIRVSTVVNILPEVKVEERADLARLKQLGFTDRSRRFSRANFRDPGDIKRHMPSQLVDLLSGTMGATVGRVNAYGGGTIPMGRGAGGTSCPMALYVDGMFYDTMRQSGRGSVPMPIEDVVNISDVRAAEIYTDGPDVPAEFQAPGLKSACGALVLWTDQSFP